MLHCRVYNTGISKDLKDAYRDRNVDYLVEQLKLSSTLMCTFSIEDENFREHMNRTYICTALLDSIKFGGSTVALMMDFINL